MQPSYHSETIKSKYSKDQLFELVMDINKYQEFLPWCQKSKIINHISDNNVEAELVIDFKAFNYSYISNIETFQSNNRNEILVTQKKGPFKSLTTKWQFIEIDSGTEIIFNITLLLKNPFLDKILKLLFDFTFKQMAQAFIKRADKIYGK